MMVQSAAYLGNHQLLLPCQPTHPQYVIMYKTYLGKTYLGKTYPGKTYQGKTYLGNHQLLLALAMSAQPP